MLSKKVISAVLTIALFVSVGSALGESSTVTYQTYGLNFSPYIWDDEDPNRGGPQITDTELLERMELIAPYTEWIRTFGCNDDLREAGMFAHSMGLKAAVGAWLGTSSTENDRQIDCLIELAREGHVDVAIVGSEVLLRGDLTEAALVDYINEVKDSLQVAGVNVPVTYADIGGVLIAHPNVMSAVDLVFANYYPYWEGRKIDHAVAYLHRQHQQVVDASGGKEVIVSETGWPSCGNQIGDAVPSPGNASFYFLNFVSWACANNVKYFYFEAYDESWKARYEGPQGACWGIWNKEGSLKPDMHHVFDGDTMDDNWTDPIPDAPIIDFAALPDFIETNIPTFVVAGFTESGNEIRLNGVALSPDAVDVEGNFAASVPLVSGDNPLELVITSGEGTIDTVEKTVRYDESFSTREKRLIYVDVALGDDVPTLPGTIVIDVDIGSVLGLIESKHIVGICPDGEEIYMSDRTVVSTDTHQGVRTLAFTQNIPANGFIVSPDGACLYSRNERLDVQSNTLLEDSPMDITTGSRWCSAPVPGGPTISGDGRCIYCGNNVQVIDTDSNSVTSTGIRGLYMSDIALTPDGSKILVSEYSYGSGRLDVYDASTFESLASISGLGDFAGEILFSKDGRMAIVGSAGNPDWSDGRVTVIDLERLERISQKSVTLADNFAASGNNEFFVSSGGSGLFRRIGIDAYVLEASGGLARAKTFFLGINRFRDSTCRPRNDQIRRIVFKAADAPDRLSEFSAEAGDRTIELSWTNPNDPDFVHTLVRYSTSYHPTTPQDGIPVENHTGDGIFPNSPGSSEIFFHTGLVNGTTYFYSAFAGDEVPNYSPAALASAAPCDTIQPSAPRSLTASAPFGRAILTWASNREADLAGYALFRDDSTDVFALLSGPDTTYVDYWPEPGIHCYWVAALDSCSNMSELCGPESTDVRGQCRPLMMAELSALYDGEQVEICWSLGNPGPVLGFNIYKTSLRDTSMIKLNADPVGSHDPYVWTDSEVTEGMTYVYALEVILGSSQAMVLVDTLECVTRAGASLAIAPNPGMRAVGIHYALSRECRVALSVFDIQGKNVGRLVDEIQPPGQYSLTWPEGNLLRTATGPGVYILSLEVDDSVDMRKVILLR